MEFLILYFEEFKNFLYLDETMSAVCIFCISSPRARTSAKFQSKGFMKNMARLENEAFDRIS